MALRHYFVLSLLLRHSLAANNSNISYDVLQYVDPLIGSANGGNVFAGASLPYGVAKAVADSQSSTNQGGFSYGGDKISGFSNMHDSGTGGLPSLGNFALFPYGSCKDDEVDGCLSKEGQVTNCLTQGGAFVRFHSPPDDTILARVGISFISSEQACSNAESEIPTFDFDATHSAAEKVWREKLSPIRVSREGVDSSLLTNFYSGIYRTMINPQDYTGENPLWNSTEPYFDSFYCLWDSFRSQLPFLTILEPKAVIRMIRSLIDTQQHLGWLPDCRMSLCKGYTQGGSNADIVLADAYIKGTMTRSISRTLEYSYDDFAISQIARGLKKTEDAEKYEATSRYCRNLFKKDQTSYINGIDTGFVGWFQPKFLNQTWGYQDPIICSNIDTSGRACSLQNNAAETFESSIWEYQFFVPHDMATLISVLDGPSEFVRRLDYLHDNGITYIGNEPAFLTVYQYHYAGRPAKSALRAHYYIPSYFKPTPDGLPGNDDSGAMGSFVAMSMMGLFPNPGQNVYFITPPFFESVNITSPITKRTARVRVKNFDPTYKNIYIQSAILDGKPYTKNWVDHAFFTEGKELVLVLGQNESQWGTREEDLPPSLSKKGGVDVNILNGRGIGGLDGVGDAGEMAVGDVVRRSSRDTFPLHRYARIDRSGKNGMIVY